MEMSMSFKVGDIVKVVRDHPPKGFFGNYINLLGEICKQSTAVRLHEGGGLTDWEVLPEEFHYTDHERETVYYIYIADSAQTFFVAEELVLATQREAFLYHIVGREALWIK